jgi:hypothetical protein
MPALADLGHDALRREWRDSDLRLEDLLGAPLTRPRCRAGTTCAVAIAAAEAGIRVLCTSEPRRSVTTVDGIAVVGRFSITRRTREGDVMSLACGRQGAAIQQRLAWDVKKVAKRLGGEAWLAVRRKIFDLGSR